jgi:hypothetical protein
MDYINKNTRLWAGRYRDFIQDKATDSQVATFVDWWRKVPTLLQERLPGREVHSGGDGVPEDGRRGRFHKAQGREEGSLARHQALREARPFSA